MAQPRATERALPWENEVHPELPEAKKARKPKVVEATGKGSLSGCGIIGKRKPKGDPIPPGPADGPRPVPEGTKKPKDIIPHGPKQRPVQETKAVKDTPLSIVDAAVQIRKDAKALPGALKQIEKLQAQILKLNQQLVNAHEDVKTGKEDLKTFKAQAKDLLRKSVDDVASKSATKFAGAATKARSEGFKEGRKSMFIRIQAALTEE